MVGEFPKAGSCHETALILLTCPRFSNFALLVLPSICWGAHEKNPDRLAELVLIGARFTQGE